MVQHHKTGRRAPIEVQPTADGNVLVTDHLYEIVPREERAGLLARGYELRKNHFATCPFAANFK